MKEFLIKLVGVIYILSPIIVAAILVGLLFWWLL